MTTPGESAPVGARNFVGGDVSLDFVNTASGRSQEHLTESLHTYDDLVTWAEHIELVGAKRAGRLRGAARARPHEAATVLTRAKALREVIFRVFRASPPAPADLDALARAAAEAAAARRLVPTDGGCVFAWPDDDTLESPLWPVSLSAAELLVSEDRERVKECASNTCDWLFVDQSRNRSRRWCDMKDCGNRAKARRFHARQRRASR